MKDLVIIAILGICGYSFAADSSLVKNKPWWPTQPPWWPSDWPTWPTKPTTTPLPPSCINYQKYPYPSDCSKFQLCLRGVLYTLDCPITLHFHGAIQDCNYPALANCEVSTEAPTTTTTEEVTTTKTEEATTTTEEVTSTTEEASSTTEEVSTTTVDEGVAPICEEFKKYPYPSDCSKYQQCIFGEFHVVDCPKPLHYHDEIQDCNYPALANCVVTTNAPITTTMEVTSTSTDDTETTTTKRPEEPITTPSSTTSTTTKPPKPGGVNCSLGDYHPHPTDCNKYYHCSNGVPFLRPCPAGLHWNAKIDTCDWPNAAGCIKG